MEIEIKTLVIWIALITISLCSLIFIIKLVRKVTGKSPYVAKKLMTDHELTFCHKLNQAIDNLGEYAVMSQVSMAAIMQPRPGLNSSDHQRARNPICQKIVDFVIIDTESNVRLVVELDDRTHESEKDKTRDDLVSSAGIQTARFRNGHKITVSEITEQLRKYL